MTRRCNRRRDRETTMDNQISAITGPEARRVTPMGALLLVFALFATPAAAQTLIVVNDSYGVPYGEPLVIEPPGVMDNDTYGGNPAADEGATVTLLTPPADGVLECASNPSTYDLCPDGSFTYDPGPSFSGSDSFTYEVALSGQTQQATVTLSACTGGPTVFVCWQETAYLARLAALGSYQTILEGFENDLVWGVTRDPLTAAPVVSQGIRWETNHPDPPASNELTTEGGGPAHTGLWGLYDADHGYATGTVGECDVDNPPEHCLYKDGFTGIREPGENLFVGAGGYLAGAGNPSCSMILDSGVPIALGRLGIGFHQFFGVIDTGGFTSFRLEETDGKIGQPRLVFGDDFTFATTSVDDTPPRVVLVNTVADTGDGVLAEGEATSAAITELLVYFSEHVLNPVGDTNPDDVTNPANYLLLDDNGNGFQTVDCAGGVAGNDVQIAVDAVTYTSGGQPEVSLTVNGVGALDAGSYRLLVCGTTSIKDWSGNTLDGDGNGTGGDDFARTFSVFLPPTPTNTPVPPTATPTPTSTPVPPTATPTPTSTPAPPTATPTPTGTLVPPTATPTPTGTLVPPTATPTPTGTPAPLSVLTIGNASITEGDSGSAPVILTITLAPASGSAVTVDWDTGGGTATPGTDYGAAAGTANIAAGQTSATVPVQVIGDLMDEPDETFDVALSNPTGAQLGAPSIGTVTIFDDDPMPNLAGADLVVLESAGQALVELTLAAASGYVVTVDYATVDDTASAPGDYTAVSGTATIFAGALSTTVAISIVPDGDVETDETFTLELTNPMNGVLLTPSVTVTIQDDDSPVLFEDGFESGDFSAWSAVVP